MYQTSILNDASYGGIYFNIERNLCTDCIKKINYANVMRYKPFWSRNAIGYTSRPIGSGILAGLAIHN